MWNLNPVLVMLHCLFLSNVLEGASANGFNSDLYLWLFGISCFLAVLSCMVIILILLCKILNALRCGHRQNTIQINSDRAELSPLSQNNDSNTCPPSVHGGNDSSSTSSDSSEGSIADLSSNSQRYVSLQGRRKTSDYINVSEGASSGIMNCKKEKTRKNVDYENVEEPLKEIAKEGRLNCADTESVNSNASDASAVNYSMVVFTKVEK